MSVNNLELSLVFGARGGVSVYQVEADKPNAQPDFCGNLVETMAFLHGIISEQIIEEEKGSSAARKNSAPREYAPGYSPSNTAAVLDKLAKAG